MSDKIEHRLSDLAWPELRRELLHYLSELCADDPRLVWQEECRRGLASGIDEVFHFFFDDHDFDESEIGLVLLDQAEVAVMEAVKSALDDVLAVVGDVGDDLFVQDPLWPAVRVAANDAHRLLASRRREAPDTGTS
jgi:hypothetical protein